MPSTALVERHIDSIRDFAGAGPRAGLRRAAAELFDGMLAQIDPPALPSKLFAAERATPADYIANWEHQVWYHLGELQRVHEGRLERAKAQGGDAWVNVPKPSQEEELASHLRELAKLRALIDAPPSWVPLPPGRKLAEDPRLDRTGAWEFPAGLSVERDPARGAAWKAQNPGGDWFWWREALPPAPIRIEVETEPVSTIKGGLILGFCVHPRGNSPLSKASGPSMGDYYTNFDGYHFSVHRGSTGYCNLRRCGPGLLMLASFGDPCPNVGQRYRVRIVKAGPQVELHVDGKLVCCYIDLGYVQPPLDGGYFGLRHFQGYYAWERGFRVARLAT